MSLKTKMRWLKSLPPMFMRNSQEPRESKLLPFTPTNVWLLASRGGPSGQIRSKVSFRRIVKADPVSIRNETAPSLMVVDTKYDNSETVEYTVVGGGHCLGASGSPSDAGTTTSRVCRFPATSFWLHILGHSVPLCRICSKRWG